MKSLDGINGIGSRYHVFDNVRRDINMQEKSHEYFEHSSITSWCFWSWNWTRSPAKAVYTTENRIVSLIFSKMSFNMTNIYFYPFETSMGYYLKRCNLQLFRILLRPNQPHRFAFAMYLANRHSDKIVPLKKHREAGAGMFTRMKLNVPIRAARVHSAM